VALLPPQGAHDEVVQAYEDTVEALGCAKRQVLHAFESSAEDHWLTIHDRLGKELKRVKERCRKAEQRGGWKPDEVLANVGRAQKSTKDATTIQDHAEAAMANHRHGHH